MVNWEHVQSARPGETLGQINGKIYRVFVNMEDIIVPPDARAGDQLGLINCHCRRVHLLILGDDNRKIVAGHQWY